MNIEKLLPVHFDPKIGEVYWKTIEKNRKDSVTIIALAGEEIIGFCLGDVHHFTDLEKVYFDGDKYGELWDIYTKPAWRGKGVGGEMIALAEKEFAKRGCPSLLLNSVDIDNEWAKRLYEKLGFKQYTFKYFKFLK